jgi:hypothetical protein
MQIGRLLVPGVVSLLLFSLGCSGEAPKNLLFHEELNQL